MYKFTFQYLLTQNMKQTLHFFLILILCNLLSPVWAQEIATLEVSLKDNDLNSALPVKTYLNPITHISDSLLSLVEIRNGEERAIDFQIVNEGDRQLVWMVEPGSVSEKRIFKLVQKETASNPPSITAKIEDGGIYLGNSSRPLLRYNFATVLPPKGVDEVFKRSGFIHPFWSPSGKELTRIQPADHYHHYGLWNPWTRVEYKGKMVDFWNLGEKQGTVRFANLLKRVNGRVFGEYKVLHEHVVFDGNKEEVGLNEIQGVRIYQQENRKDIYIADISILLSCATDNPVTLKEYRYGGLGWRATEKWHKDNSETITSNGKNRKESDGSLARWVIVQGELDEVSASVLMMSFPTNYNHPEPLRIWPEDIYDRGDVFANFSPTKDKDWVLDPGKNYQLNYRFFVSDNKIDPEEAEKLWQQFANPPEIMVTLAKK